MADPTQTSYVDTPPAGRPGQEYDCAFTDIVSWTADEAIPFGAFVCETREGGCELPDSSAEITANKGGIALIDPTLASGVGYQIGDTVRVMRAGRAFGLVEETIAKGDACFVRFAAQTGTQKGALRNDVDTASCVVAPGMSVFKAGTVANGVVFELKYPGSATG